MLRLSFSSLLGTAVRKPISDWLKHKDLVTENYRSSFSHSGIQGLKGVIKLLVCFSLYSAFEHISFILGAQKAAQQLWALSSWGNMAAAPPASHFSTFRLQDVMAL